MLVISAFCGKFLQQIVLHVIINISLRLRISAYAYTYPQVEASSEVVSQK